MKKNNPFWKYVKCEALLQYQVCSYVQHAHKDVKIFHSPNVNHRTTPLEKFLMSIMGVKPGYPDLHLCSSRRNLFIELKWGNNIPSQEQKEWLSRLSIMLGASAYVCWSYESAVKLINYDFTGVMKDDHNNEYDDQILVYQGMPYLESDLVPQKFFKTKYI